MSIEDIIKQPGYISLRSKLAEGSSLVTLWIGAGLSKDAGMPLWEDLYARLKAGLLNIDSDGIKDSASQLKALEEQKESPWVRMEFLKNALGKESYRQLVRSIFSRSESCPIPPAYKALISIPHNGIVNFNLDLLAQRSYVEKFPGRHTVIFTSQQIPTHYHVLKSGRHFIAHVHGQFLDEDSWILTHSDLSRVLKTSSYINFLKNILISRTVIFIGITASDIAIASLIEPKLNEGHYWLTHRKDVDTHNWAQDNGIQPVVYRSIGNDHSQLEEIIKDLASYKPTDTPAPPVIPNDDHVDLTNNNMPGPNELRLYDSNEDIRLHLNTAARRLLYEESELPSAYTKFSEDYDESIHRAWYINTKPPHNVFFGYTIEEFIQEGGFGKVYRAKDKDGQYVAIKIMRESVWDDKLRLNCFRRGVHSMRILSERNVKGMVPYIMATELPPCAVMPFIEGADLQTAIEKKYIKTWASVLYVARELAKTLAEAHGLPERVYHRDIRPRNIMLEGLYEDPDDFRVVLLDFDLSWHMGASGLSVVETANYYQAPEQLHHIAGISTRRAAVDSYGLGMTLLFLRTGIPPQYMQHMQSTWHEFLLREICCKSHSSWQSLPRRFARLIEKCTKHNQEQRPLMLPIFGELDLLHIKGSPIRGSGQTQKVPLSRF
jgi:eukaryotic-like serine/threonine-protein kinase